MSIGAVMDKPGFFPGFCLEKNLVLFTGGERSAQFDAITERLGLKPYLQKKFRQCSSGVQKRCELAAALLQESELFVLDEPLSGLDPAGIYAFRSIVRDLQAARSTIILADHALNELEKFCTKICFLKRGIIREIATMDELQKRFDNLEEAYRFYNLNIS
jgi:ABC-2 type transport system ATP-binding protein